MNIILDKIEKQSCYLLPLLKHTYYALNTTFYQSLKDKKRYRTITILPPYFHTLEKFSQDNTDEKLPNISKKATNCTLVGMLVERGMTLSWKTCSGLGKGPTSQDLQPPEVPGVIGLGVFQMNVWVFKES